MRNSLAFVALLGGILRAEDAPKIPPDLRAKFWRAQTEMLSAKAQYELAKAKSEDYGAEMKKICGAPGVTAGADGEPECAKAPEPKK